MMKNLMLVVLLSFFVCWASGCATIVHGTTTKVSVDSEPQGATAKIGDQTIITPGTVTVKNNKAHYVEFSLVGYHQKILNLEQSMSGWVFGNFLFGGFIGVAIDYTSGGAYKIEPKEVHAKLEPKE